MKRAKHKLTDVACRNAKPNDRPYKLADGGGLHLLVLPSGVKTWQYRYEIDGKEQTASLGRYDEGVTLTQARAAANKAREQVAGGAHYTKARKLAKAQRQASHATTFGAIRDAWIADQARRGGWSAVHKGQVEASLANHVSELDGLPIAEIRMPIVDRLLRKLETKTPGMAEKVSQRVYAIFDYAVGRAIEINPLARRGKVKSQRKHRPAVLAHKGVGDILRNAARAEVCKGARRAHLLVAFTALRISEVAGARWAEFDLEPRGKVDAPGSEPYGALWRVPRERMKIRDPERGPHPVPLPTRLLGLLREWKREDGKAEYACPAPRDPSKPITIEAVEKFYRRLGLAGKHSPHGWRAVFSTWSSEDEKWQQQFGLIEAQQDRLSGTTQSQPYHRGQKLELRRDLMQWYEDSLIAARDGATVTPIRKKA